ncbi:MAG: diguanylate cyclase, partial [Synechococcus sp. ELA057]
GRDLNGFVAKMRLQGQPDFRIHPPGPRRQAAVIAYLQPINWRNQRAIGFDMLSEPTRRQALEQAAYGGDITLSGPVRLQQENGSNEQVGAVLYGPVYRGGEGSFVTAQDRWRQLRGWVFAPLRMGDLISSAIADLGSPLIHDTTIVIEDADAPASRRRLFDSIGAAGRASVLQRQEPMPSTWMQVSVANRLWRIGIQLGPSHGTAAGWSAPLILELLLGLSLSALAALITQRLVANHLALGEALERERQATREQALASTVFETSPVGIVVTDADGIVLRVNPAYTRLSGYAELEARGHKANLLRSGRHDEGFYRALWEAIVQRGHWSGEIWNRHRNGQILRHELAITAVHDAQQQIVNFVGLLWDITERYTQQQQMHHLATHDQLTGLANRALLMDLLTSSLALARRHDQKVALLFLDLNGFKAVNDRFGHATGDALLRTAAERLSQGVRESDTLCRQGGDEFVLLIPQAPDLEQLNRIARKLRDSLAAPYPSLPEGVRISVSIGIALWPDHADDADGLLDAADNAMYCAKQRGEELIAMAQPRVRAPQAGSERPSSEA